MTLRETTGWNLIERARTRGRDARAGFARRYEPLVRKYLGERWARSPLLEEL